MLKTKLYRYMKRHPLGRKVFFVGLGLAALIGTAQIADRTAESGPLSARQAIQHVGEVATVCGSVASTHFARLSNERPTFINLGKPYPHQVFTIVVWGEDRPAFSEPPENLSGYLCVTGRISSYHGVAEMEVSSPSQIRQRK